MNNCLVFFNSAVAAGLTDVDITGVTDQSVTINSNSHYIPDTDWRLLAAYVLGTSVTRGKLLTPSLRAVSAPYIAPVERSATVPSLPHFAKYGDQGPILIRNEEMQVQVSNNLGAATEVESAVLFVDRPGTPLSHGTIITVRGTCTGTGVTGAWVLTPITLDQTLKVGRYAVVGMSVVAINALAARLQLPGYVPRPGCLTRNAIGNDDWSYWRRGNFGSYGEFYTTAQPQLEFFSLGACTAQEVYLDLIWLSP